MPPKHRRLTDSPWYWVYLFCTAGLIALLIMGPKYTARQTQIERKERLRQRAAREVAGQQLGGSASSQDGTSITLVPLYVILALIFLFAGYKLWRDYFRPRKQFPRPEAEASEHLP